MAAMFDGDFTTGPKDFEELITRFPASLYSIDASYRLAVCHYALGEYDLAEKQLFAFVL